MPGSNLTPVLTNPVSPYLFTDIPPASFNASTDTIDLGVAHNFSTGNCIWGTASASSLNTTANIVHSTKYFVIVSSTTAIKLATTAANASNNIALDITAPSANMDFSKFNGYAAFDGKTFLINQSLSYAKSSAVFNSSNPVEINFTIPSFSSSFPSGTFNIYFLQCLLRQPSTNNYWGGALRISSNSVATFKVFGGTTETSSGLSFPSAPIFTSSNFTSGSFLSGYKQKYVITSSRTIECWFATGSNTLSLLYTIPALTPNINLVFEFGSGFDFLKLEDCTIKYL